MSLLYAIPAAVVLAYATYTNALANPGDIPVPPSWPGAPPARPAAVPIRPEGDPPVAPTVPRAFEAPPAPPRTPCAPVASPTPPCGAWGDDPRRGPAEIHDGHVFAQPRMTLTAISPDTLGCGRSSLRASFLWSSMFGANQDVSGENDSPRRFRIDAETWTLDLAWRHGVAENVDVGVRLPVHWRGGGVMDGLINWFHALDPNDFRDNGRTDYRDDQFRVNGKNTDGTSFDWDGKKGYGLGDVEGEVRWRFADGGRDGWSAALVGRLGLPTATEPYDTGALSFGAQVATAKRFARAFDLFLGAGATAWTADEIDGVRYEDVRGHGFAAVEWRPGHAWSLIAEFEAATAVTRGIQRFGERHLYVNVDAKIDVSASTQMEFGFTENIPTHQESNTDFAIHLGLVVGW